MKYWNNILNHPLIDYTDGVGLLSKYKGENKIEDLYLKLRSKEGRVLSDDLVKKLPDLPLEHPHFEEWQLRKDTVDSFCEFLKMKKEPLKILDLGCGNGWFSSKMAEIEKNEVLGLDLNLYELKQAQSLFSNDRLQFAYGDIFEDLFGKDCFDMVVINSAIQYFPSIPELFWHLFEILKSGGEIHILDSPFYKKGEVELARNRTMKYYKSIGCTEMAEFYFHHSLDDFTPFSPTYKRLKFYFLNKILGKKQNPFVWTSFQKK